MENVKRRQVVQYRIGAKSGAKWCMEFASNVNALFDDTSEILSRRNHLYLFVSFAGEP